MKKLVFISFYCLLLIANCELIMAQTGNVGIGTDDPQAKLHVNGDARIDNKLEIKDSIGNTIFKLDPQGKSFELMDSVGNVFYRIAIENAKSDFSVSNGNSDNKANPKGGDPLVNVVRDGPTLITTRRNTDGQIISIETFDSGGTPATTTTAITKFNPVTGKRISEQVENEDGGTIKEFYPDGTTPKSIFCASSDGSSTLQEFRADGSKYVENFTEALPSGGFKSIVDRFDSDENLLKEAVIDQDGNRKFFNKNGQEITREEYKDIYDKTITNPSTGATNTTNAEGNNVDNGTGNSTTTTAGNVNVKRGDNENNLNDIGMNQTNSADGSAFFSDIFGISKFNGSGGFTGMGFDASSAGITMEGDLNILGALAKLAGSFKIDHPLDPYNKFLYHSFVESPDMMNIYNGNITTDGNGFASVQLPDYFKALNKEYRYQLTVIGTFAQAIISKKVQNNQFEIKTSQPNVEVSWQVTGIRDDRYARENRLQVEVKKSGTDKGRLLYDPNRQGPYSEGLQKHWEKHQSQK